MENAGPGFRGTGYGGTGSRGVENTGSGGKHGVSVEGGRVTLARGLKDSPGL